MNPLYLKVCLCLACISISVAVLADEVPATWAGGVGQWTDASWGLAPPRVYPDNGDGSGNKYVVTIPKPPEGTNTAVTLSVSTKVKSLSLNATLQQLGESQFVLDSSFTLGKTGFGTYTLRGEAGVVVGEFVPGHSGTGTMVVAEGWNAWLTQSERSTIDVIGRLVVGQGNVTGTYTMEQGNDEEATVSLHTQQTLLGEGGIGRFNQEFGLHSTIYLSVGTSRGEDPNVNSIYNLRRGTLDVGNEVIGDFAHGEFLQGGISVHTITGSLVIGQGPDGIDSNYDGLFTLSGGKVTVKGDEEIGGAGKGYFLQGGGEHSVEGITKIAADSLFEYTAGDWSGNELENAGTILFSKNDDAAAKHFKKVTKEGIIRVTPSGRMWLDCAETIAIEKQTVDISGTLVLEGTGGMSSTSTTTLVNQGEIKILGDSDLIGAGSLVNTGRFTKASGGGESRIEWGVSAGGVFDVQAGRVWLAGPVAITSGMNKTGAGVLDITGPQSHSLNSTLTVGQGTLNLNTDAGASGARHLTVSVVPSSQGYSALANFNAPQQLAGLAAYLGGEVVLAEGGQAPLTVDGLNLTAVGDTYPTGRLEVNDNTVTAWGGAAYALGSYYA